MYQKSFVLSYITWHYSKAFADIWNTCLNYIWAVYHFFSVSLLLKTFFKPWHKMDIEYGKGISMESFLGPLIVNTLMRLVGMILRAVIIVCGLASIIVIFLVGVAVTIIWPFLPIIVVFLFYRGFSMI